jgi:hypothetical protein
VLLIAKEYNIFPGQLLADGTQNGKSADARVKDADGRK